MLYLVSVGYMKSESFVSNVGVRQGENLYPILFFFLFLNDLSQVITHANNILNNISEMSNILLGNNVIEVFFKLYIDSMSMTLLFLRNLHWTLWFWTVNHGI